jgi:hypothetical protein
MRHAGNSGMKMQSLEDEFLARLARGGLVSQDEWEQIADLLPPDQLASALARRFDLTGESRMLVMAAQLYMRSGDVYHALEACSRAPSLRTLQAVVQQAIPRVQRDYPDAQVIGKLLDEAFLVIDLTTGKMTRYPPLLPARL